MTLLLGIAKPHCTAAPRKSLGWFCWKISQHAVRVLKPMPRRIDHCIAMSSLCLGCGFMNGLCGFQTRHSSVEGPHAGEGPCQEIHAPLLQELFDDSRASHRAGCKTWYTGYKKSNIVNLSVEVVCLVFRFKRTQKRAKNREDEEPHPRLDIVILCLHVLYKSLVSFCAASAQLHFPQILQSTLLLPKTVLEWCAIYATEFIKPKETP